MFFFKIFMRICAMRIRIYGAGPSKLQDESDEDHKGNLSKMKM